MTSKRAIFFVVVASLAACTSSSEPGAPDSGSGPPDGGGSSMFTDQTATVGSNNQGIEIDLAQDFTGMCNVMNGMRRANVDYLRIQVYNYAGRPGTFQVASSGTSNRNIAYEEHTMATCEFETPSREGDGTVTITDVSPSGIKGTFDMTFPDGRLTGSFDTTMCATCDPRAMNCPQSTCQ